MHFRKSLSILSAISCLLLCSSAFALQSGDFTYTTDNVTVTITGYNRGYSNTDAEVVIPAAISGKPVVSIGADVFSGQYWITSIAMPNSITSIGDRAFSSCIGLTGITIPESVTSIGADAFQFCSGLTILNVPRSVLSIGPGAFSRCSGLVGIVVNAGNTAYSSQAGVLYTKAGSTLIQCPGGKTGGLVIPGSVTSIGDSAFWHCTGLTEVSIPESVKSIGSSSFAHCSGLTEMTIPASVTRIGESAFYECSGLTDIDVDEDNTVYSSRDGVLYNKAETVLIQYPGGRAGGFTIPDGVAEIGEGAFADCAGLTELTMHDGVTSIGEAAFVNCSGLTEVTISDSVQIIGGSAFAHCSALTGLTLGSGVASIGAEAFEACGKLAGVTIPASVKSIEFRAFSYCSGLTAIDVDPANTTYSSHDGALYDKAGTVLIQCPGGKSDWLIIPSGVTSIGVYAVAGCDGITRVTIPDSVTGIGEYAFFGCDALAQVTIGSGVTGIGDSAFFACDKLKRAEFYGNAPELGKNVFYGCAEGFTVHYLEGATGFTDPWHGYPTAVFTPSSCPAAKVLGADNPKLASLRAFRDSLLARSAAGRKLAALYYNNSDSINVVLERSPVLRGITRRLLDAFAP